MPDGWPIAHCDRSSVSPFAARGFTLVEMLVVVALLVIVAGIVVVRVSRMSDGACATCTQTSMNTLRDVIIGRDAVPGYSADVRQFPATLTDLLVVPSTLPASKQFFDRNTGIGWRGPYIQNPNGQYAVNAANGFTTAYGNTGDPAVLDAWMHPIVLQIPTVGTPEQQIQYARLVSAGPDGVIQTPPNVLWPDPSMRGDDCVIFLNTADVHP